MKVSVKQISFDYEVAEKVTSAVVTFDGKWQKVSIQGVFDSDISLEANDIILLPKNLVHSIFGVPETEVTDIVLKIANPKEISTSDKINDDTKCGFIIQHM